ncbi:MAG: threonine/serine exporter family protein [Tissierellia bacterium]|nr:threonine/serine exporter family protein [Tissierellia bacterium]
MDNENALYKVALYAGEIMVRSGSETYRAEDTIRRMLNSRGKPNVATFVSPTVIIIGDRDTDGVCYVQNISERSSNLEKIELVNTLSRRFVDENITVEEANEELKKIASIKGYPYWLSYLGCTLSCAIFAVLIGGRALDFFAAFIASGIAFHTNNKISEMSHTVFLGNYLASALVSIVALLFYHLGFSANLDSTIVGSVLPLVPGVAFTNGIRDFISGDLISGTARCIEAVMIGIAIAFGVGSVLTLYNFFGGII